MRDSLLIQIAVFGALDGAYGLPTVYDEVPERDDGHELVRPPYVVIGESTEEPDDTHDEYGTSETITLHTWSAAESNMELKRIMGAVDEILHRARLALQDGRLIMLSRSFSEILREPAEPEAGTWRHGIQRYRARTLQGVAA